ncbi:MAG: tetratricopeptide repeat protein [Acidobacteria bacterium]|nr:tetratricopeptide repeat protein [Acidobacteriota bacterium]
MLRLSGKAILLVAIVLWLAPYTFAEADSEQAPKNIKLMTVAELEKAGDASRTLRDYHEAARYFGEAIRRDKKNAPIYNKLGLSYLQGGNADAARIAFGKAVKLKPDYTDALNNLGVVYFQQKRLNDAAKYFRRAIALDETRAAFHINLGVVLFSQKKVELAIKEYARAFELDPDVLDKSVRAGLTARIANREARARFYYELARMQADRGNFEECLLSLAVAKENGYDGLADVYRYELFSRLWDDPRLHEIVAPPEAK